MQCPAQSINISVSAYNVVWAPHFSLMLMCFFWVFITLPGAPQCTCSRVLSCFIDTPWGPGQSGIQKAPLLGLGLLKQDLGMKLTVVWISKEHNLVHVPPGCVRGWKPRTVCWHLPIARARDSLSNLWFFHLKAWHHPQYWEASLSHLKEFFTVWGSCWSKSPVPVNKILRYPMFAFCRQVGSDKLHKQEALAWLRTSQ